MYNEGNYNKKKGCFLVGGNLFRHYLMLLAQQRHHALCLLVSLRKHCRTGLRQDLVSGVVYHLLSHVDITYA